ncbi:uncharacterized protein B0T15DRAFT_527149 [Chaetomium strumarium]|uniref:Secreted protein n=1 Tax=Chaetomium strumarium TaxID=1170767 RepID=A0AAJ0GUP8_9PEZI|nr:hypothetical protein B0T15DRAFT_527149 [Chaetomium strumarium]
MHPMRDQRMLGVLLSIHIWSVIASGHTSGSAAEAASACGGAVRWNLESRADPIESTERDAQQGNSVQDEEPSAT